MKNLVDYGHDGPFLKLMEYIDFIVGCYGLRDEKVAFVSLTLDGTRAGVAVFNVRLIHPQINPNSLKHVHTCMVYYGSDDKSSIKSRGT